MESPTSLVHWFRLVSFSCSWINFSTFRSTEFQILLVISSYYFSSFLYKVKFGGLYYVSITFYHDLPDCSPGWLAKRQSPIGIYNRILKESIPNSCREKYSFIYIILKNSQVIIHKNILSFIPPFVLSLFSYLIFTNHLRMSLSDFQHIK